MHQAPQEPPLPETAEAAETEARGLVSEVLEMLEPVVAPDARRREYLVEQLSFLQARENYRAFATLLDSGDDVPAATLARARSSRSRCVGRGSMKISMKDAPPSWVRQHARID
jgi:hypothetical protein